MPLSLVKNLVLSLSVGTFCLAPVAQGAAAANKNKELINTYLKETGLTTRKVTVGEYWKMVRHVYPESLQIKMDQWVAYHKSDFMPTFAATTFIDKENVEQVRVTLNKDGQSFSMTFTGNEDTPIKINSVLLTKSDLLNYEKFDGLVDKVVSKDKAMSDIFKNDQPVDWTKLDVFTAEDFNKFTPRQKAEYLFHFRQVLEAADKIMQNGNGDQVQLAPKDKYEWVIYKFFGESVWAQQAWIPYKKGNQCVVAGFLSVYDSMSCGGKDLGSGNIQKQMKSFKVSYDHCQSKIPCNPLVYGLNPNNGNKAFCVPTEDKNQATAKCNSISALKTPEDKKRIIESYMKVVAEKDVEVDFNPSGKVSQEQKNSVSDFLNAIGGHISAAKNHCCAIGAMDTRKRSDFACGNVSSTNKNVKVPNDQSDACANLLERSIDLQAFVVAPTPPVPNPSPSPLPSPAPLPSPSPAPMPPVDQSCTGAGQKFGPSKNSCVCLDGNDVPTDGCSIEVVVDKDESPSVGNKTQQRKQDPSWWQKNRNWAIPLGVTGAMLGLFWWMTKSKAKTTNPVFIPPAPAPNPTPSSGTTTVSPTPNPLPPAPTSITGPPIIPGEGGGKVGAPMGGGVR